MTNSLFQGKSILLISPSFFGYDQAVVDKLTQMGADVVWFDDRPSNGLVDKSLIRINKQLLASRTAKYYAKISQDISRKSFDIIFLLNPEALPVSFLQTCKSLWKNALYVMYMWDSIKNRKHTLEFVPFCDRIFTFDVNDSQEHGFLFKPLFFIDEYTSIRHSSSLIHYDICFMGTLHSDRYAIAKKIREWCDQNHLKSFFYFFMQSRVLYYYDKLKIGSVIAPREEVSFTKLNTANLTDILASSKVVLDIQHPKQTGLTMRTLEVIGAGKKLITTNSSIKEYDFYQPENISIVDRQNPMQDLNLSFFDDVAKPISENIVESYSIGAWLSTVLAT
jgi:hypothetical protein